MVGVEKESTFSMVEEERGMKMGGGSTSPQEKHEALREEGRG